MNLDTQIRYVKEIGPARAKLFNKLGVFVVEDLLNYFPKEWILPTDAIKINQMQVGKNAIIVGRIKSTEYNRFSKFPVFKVVVEDNTGSCEIVWYNGGWLRNQLQVGQLVMLSGKVSVEK